MKTALIDPGGGMKGAFAAGVTDAFLDTNTFFDICVGVSAGSANLASYASKQRGRTHAFYLNYAMRKEYGSVSNFIRKKTYFDFDYIFTTLTNRGGENPLDYPEFEKSPTEFIFVGTNALTGRPIYFHKSSVAQDSYEVFKASCSIPWLCTPRNIRNVPIVDGTMSDPMPVQKALDAGADYIVVILPSGFRDEKEGMMNSLTTKLLTRSKKTRWLSGLERAMKERPGKYNEALEYLRTLQAEGRAMVISPASEHTVTPLSKNRGHLEALYQDGYRQGILAAEKLRQISAQSVRPVIPAETENLISE